MTARAWPPLMLALAAMCAVAALLASERVEAGEALANGSFDSWAGSLPEGWQVAGQVTRSEQDCVSGACVAFAATTVLTQTVAVAAGTELSVEVSVRAVTGTGRAVLRLEFLDPGLIPTGTAAVDEGQLALSVRRLRGAVSAPPTAAWVSFVVEISATGGPFSGTVDAASLVASDSPETPTPEPLDTPTREPTSTPTTAPTATQQPRTPTPTRAATSPASTRTPTAEAPSPTPTGRPAATPTATRPPSPTPAGPTVSPPPPVPPPGGSGGLLVDGDFESVFDGEPAFWDHFGGLLSSEPEAVSGLWSALLLSDSAATKWVMQAVPVEGAAWYAGSAWARVVSGEGEVFVRVSWYASSDGSGSAISQDDGGVSTSASWSRLTIGPIRAPSTARSARFRLMLRPSGPAAALYDDARFYPSEAPAATPTPTPTSTVGPSADTATPGASATPTRTGTRSAISSSPTPPAGVRSSGGGSTAPAAGARAAGSDAGLRLNEVLVDPIETGRDNGFEWVELFNAGSEAVDLAGWQLGDARTSDPLPSFVLEPGAFVVVAGNDTAFATSVPVIRVRDGTIGSGLNNDGDAVRLIDPGGAVTDSVTFGGDQTPGPRALGVPDAGETLGRDQVDAWRVTSRPTPGEANIFPASPSPAANATPGASATTQGSEVAAGGTPGGRPFADVRREADDGSGWLWPAALVAAALVLVGGVAYWAGTRRNRGSDGG